MNASADDIPTPSVDGIDRRSPEVRRMDYMSDRVVELTDLLQKLLERNAQGHTQTVIHRQQGMGAVGIVCATICAMCLLFLILGAILIVPEIHDLNAWKDIHQAKIAKLEAMQEKHS